MQCSIFKWCCYPPTSGLFFFFFEITDFIMENPALASSKSSSSLDIAWLSNTQLYPKRSNSNHNFGEDEAFSLKIPLHIASCSFVHYLGNILYEAITKILWNWDVWCLLWMFICKIVDSTKKFVQYSHRKFISRYWCFTVNFSHRVILFESLLYLYYEYLIL